VWVLTSYFAEGLPYALVRQVSTVFFKDAGASLEAVGMTSLYGLPWTLKFLQAPLVDGFGIRKRWVVGLQVALGIAALALALGAGVEASLGIVAVLFLGVALLSATHDIAVDGLYLDLMDRAAQARWVGFQAMAYRLALIAGGGGVVVLSGTAGWPVAFGAAAAVLLALAVLHAVLLDRGKEGRPASQMLRPLARPKVWLSLALGALLARLGTRAWGHPSVLPLRELLGVLPGTAWVSLALLLLVLLLLAAGSRLRDSKSLFARAFLDWLNQPRVGLILAFLVTFRLGESFLLGMVYPMLSDCGVTRSAYGVMYGTFGISASIAGGILGGWLIGRFGMRRVLWLLVGAQNLPNLLYAFAAWRYAGGGALAAGALPVLTSFVVLEAFGAGMGTAAFMVFVMRTTRPAFKATHMAIATGIMNVAGVFAGVVSGALATRLGFPLFFTFTFLATLPGMILIPFLPLLGDAPEDCLDRQPG
jgi:PAT family beta-lactamase induction signal transducer AmpG